MCADLVLCVDLVVCFVPSVALFVPATVVAALAICVDPVFSNVVSTTPVMARTTQPAIRDLPACMQLCGDPQVPFATL